MNYKKNTIFYSNVFIFIYIQHTRIYVYQRRYTFKLHLMKFNTNTI